MSMKQNVSCVVIGGTSSQPLRGCVYTRAKVIRWDVRNGGDKSENGLQEHWGRKRQSSIRADNGEKTSAKTKVMTINLMLVATKAACATRATVQMRTSVATGYTMTTIIEGDKSIGGDVSNNSIKAYEMNTSDDGGQGVKRAEIK